MADIKVKRVEIYFSYNTPDWYLDVCRKFISGAVREFEDSHTKISRFSEAKAKGVDIDAAYNCEDNASNVRERAIPYLKGKGLDVGCGIEKILPDAIGIDSGADYGETREKERHAWDDKRDAHDLSGYENMDYVFSSHCLEHLDDWEKALKEWCRVLRPGGTLFLYLPWAEAFFMHSKEFRPGHKHDFSPDKIASFLEEIGMKVVEKSTEPDNYGSFIVVARKEG